MDDVAVVVEGSRCAVHPERPGTACARCGTFGCPACLRPLEGGLLCPDCRARSQAALPSLGPRARWARGAILASSAAGLAAVPLSAKSVAQPGGGAVALLLLVAALVQLAAPVFFLRWFHLAVRHALALGLALDATPWGAVGTWFIPFANLVRPFDLTRRLCPGAPVGPWQALYLGGRIGSSVVEQFAPGYSVLPALVIVGAALAGGKVVQDVTARLAAPAT